jgi:PTS system beta-glucosides-specific IIC component
MVTNTAQLAGVEPVSGGTLGQGDTAITVQV